MMLSDKQKQVFRFFASDKDMLFCDGAVRSGKTYSLLLAFLMWSTTMGRGLDFGLAGRTIGTLRRNIIYENILPLQQDPDVQAMGGISINLSQNFFIFAGNTFYWYGGDKETSQFLIQGKTLAGLFVDEVTTVLQSFLDMALSRCSVEGAKVVFSCNPSTPTHWFKTNYIDKTDALNALHLHWVMDDNPSLSEKVKERLRRMFSGVFFQRYILGLWVAAEGVIFPQFANNPNRWVIDAPANDYRRLFVGVDFGGNQSKTIFILAGIRDGEYRPEIHIIDCHHVKDPGAGVDSETITREYVQFVERAEARFGMPVFKTNTDHLEAQRLSMVKAMGRRSVRFVDKSTISLTEWVKILGTLFNLDMIKIVAGLDMVVDCYKGLLFDEKATDDRPLDDGKTCDVDTYDASRYAVIDPLKDWIRRGILTA